LLLYRERLASKETDVFGVRSQAIEHAERLLQEQPPFCYAVTGPWGSGKSTFLRFLREHLQSRACSNSQVLTFYFNAWRHSEEENLHLAFLDDLRNFIRRATGAFHFSPVMRLRLALIGKAISHYSKLLSGYPAGLNLALPLLRLVLRERTGSMLEAHATLGDIRKGFRKVVEDLSGRGFLLVIIIDEIDRCPPDRAVRVLETVRTFFFFDEVEAPMPSTPFQFDNQQPASDHNVIFVTSFDDNYVANAYKSVYGLSESDAYRYLLKFMQFYYQMSSPNYSKFVRTFLKDHPRFESLGLEADEIAKVINRIGARSIRDVRLLLVHFFDWTSRWFAVDQNREISEVLGKHRPPDLSAQQYTKCFYATILEAATIKLFFPRFFVWLVRSKKLTDIHVMNLEGKKGDWRQTMNALLETKLERIELQQIHSVFSEWRKELLDSRANDKAAAEGIRIALEVAIGY